VRQQSLRLGDVEREELRTGAAGLGVTIDAGAERKFAAYADQLGLWNDHVNLVACHSAAELVERHFLDSLAVDSLLPSAGLVADLGTGAGFPGVPLAVVNPSRPFVLVEARRRRANFLREAKRALHLDNVEIVEGRAETPPSSYAGRAACIITRAVWSDEAVFDIAAKWVESGGTLIWSRTDALSSVREIGPFRRKRSVQYRIGRGRGRTLEVFLRD
jgi:16S rRNA (guanine527-N7)-methyltransferase